MAVVFEYAKIVPTDGACFPNFQWRFCVKRSTSSNQKEVNDRRMIRTHHLRTATEDGCMIRKWHAEHGQELHHKPTFLVKAKAYVFVCHVQPKHFIFHWVSVVRAYSYILKVIFSYVPSSQNDYFRLANRWPVPNKQIVTFTNLIRWNCV